MTKYIGNAFSLSMLDSFPSDVNVTEVSVEFAKEFVKGAESVIGHSSTAEVVSRLLGVEVPVNRVMLKLKQGDQLLVFQLLVRLEEGRVLTDEELLELPYKFILVTVKADKVEMTREEAIELLKQLIPDNKPVFIETGFYEYTATYSISRDLLEKEEVEISPPSGRRITESLSNWQIALFLKELNCTDYIIK